MTSNAAIHAGATARRGPPRPQLLDVGLAAVVCVVQIIGMAAYQNWGDGIVLTLAMAAATLFARSTPAVSVGIIWVAGLMQIWLLLDLEPSQFGIVWVAYCAARFSRVGVLVISGVSALVGTVLAGTYFSMMSYSATWYLGFSGSLYRMQLRADELDGPLRLLAAMLIAVGPLILPWIVGVIHRLIDASRASTQERDAAVEEKSAAEELRDAAERERTSAVQAAALEAYQARLARDVHDVVGHSLAVILAQAQAGQYLDHEDELRETLANIGHSARRSLTEVRQVLGELRDGTPQKIPVDGIERIVESLRASGIEVRETVLGGVATAPAGDRDRRVSRDAGDDHQCAQARQRARRCDH